MAGSMPIGEEPDLAPVDYVVIEFDSLEPSGEGLDILLDLVEHGIIRILDFEVIKRNPDGTVVGMKAEDVDGSGIGSFDVFIGASSGLLQQDDFDAVGAVLQPGSTAVALLYENTWAKPFVRSVRSQGGRVVTSGRVGVSELLAALDTAEAEAAGPADASASPDGPGAAGASPAADADGSA